MGAQLEQGHHELWVQGQENAAWNTVGAQCLHVVSAGQGGLAWGRGMWGSVSPAVRSYRHISHQR